MEARDIANFYIAAGVTSYHASFVGTTKPGPDAGMEGANADPASSTGFWNEVLWNNFLAFTDALANETGLPVIAWDLPYGHIDHSQLAPPTGGVFPDLADQPQSFEDSASDFFFGDTFLPGAGNRLTFFGTSDPLLSVGVSGNAVTWPSGMSLGANHGVRLILFGPHTDGSTDGTSNPPTDGGWWITALQNYYLSGPVALTPTSNPVSPVPVPRPAVTAWAIKPKVMIGTGEKGKIMLALSEPAPSRMVIHYKLTGQAVNHVTYTLKKYKVVVQPGDTQFVLKIKPRNVDLGPGVDNKKVKLLLQPGDGYVVGTPTPVKVKILAADN